MDKDQVSGKFDQAVGKIKEKLGDAVGNDRLANEGVADQVKGSAKETWGNVKDAVATTRDHHTDTTETRAAEHRGSFTDKVAEIRSKVNDKIDDYKERERTRDVS